MVEEVQKLKKKLDGIVKLPVKHRNEPPAAVTKFREDLDKTFKAWPRNVRERMEIQDNIYFFISMQGDRKAESARMMEEKEMGAYLARRLRLVYCYSQANAKAKLEPRLDLLLQPGQSQD